MSLGSYSFAGDRTTTVLLTDRSVIEMETPLQNFMTMLIVPLLKVGVVAHCLTLFLCHERM